jgi:hypothetical protein
MAPNGKRLPKTKPVSSDRRESPSFEGRGDPRRRQYNTDNLSSEQLAPATADETYASDAAVPRFENSVAPSSLFLQAGNEPYLENADEEVELENNYTLDQPLSSIGTTSTGQTETAARDSFDGRHRSSFNSSHPESFVLVTREEAIEHPSNATVPVADGTSLTFRNLANMNDAAQFGYNGHIESWAETARPRYTRRMMERASTHSRSPSNQSNRSSIISQDWVITPEPLPVALLAIGEWQAAYQLYGAV